MAQQIMGRAPNIFDYFQMRALARRTPKTIERDIEGENRLRIELVKAIADLEKTKADIRKATVSGMTDMYTKFATAQASMLAALADEAKASAMTADAKAALIKTVSGEFEQLNGVMAAGAPEASFMEKVADPATGIASAQTAFTSAVSNPDNQMAGLIKDLTPAVGSPERVGASFDGLVNALDQQFVTGPSGMVSRVNEQLRGSSPTMLAPNANGALRQVVSGIGAAVNSMNIPEDQKRAVYDELVLRAATRIESDAVAASGNQNIFTEYAATQSEALQRIERNREQAFKRLGAGIDPKMKSLFVSNFMDITGAITKNDPIAQLQVARSRLAEQGITPPDAMASEEAKMRYNDQLKKAVSETIPMEGFAQRMATLPVSPEIDKQIAYLKTLLGTVGQVTPDALTAATAKLRQSMGNEQFDAWRQLVGAGTDEDAAVLAAQNPGKLQAFRGISAQEPMAVKAPVQFRAAVAGTAADEAAALREAGRKSAEAYTTEQKAAQEPKPQPSMAMGEQGQQKAPEAPTAAAETAGAPEVAMGSVPSTEPAVVAPVTQKQRFSQAVEQAGTERAQLFGTSGLMSRQARIAMGLTPPPQFRQT